MIQEKKICKYCDVEMKKLITSPAQLYDSAMADDDLRASVPFWTGDYYCPKCDRMNCWR